MVIVMINMCYCLSKIKDFEKFIDCYEIAKLIIKNIEIKDKIYTFLKI